MEKNNTPSGMTFKVIIIFLAMVLLTKSVVAQDWYNSNWSYRMPVTVTNPGSDDLWEFQVQINLTQGGNFDFGKALGSGTDVRITDSDGTSLIPFWIESWINSTSASLWVRVPRIPVGGKTIYLYYGNSTGNYPPVGVPVETPPIGPWDRLATPIYPSGANPNHAILAENIIFDRVTGHYWMCYANYSTNSIDLCYSDAPDIADSWTWSGSVITAFGSERTGGDGSDFLAGAPHLLLYDNTWYLFYSDWPDIFVATASNVAGPYTVSPTPALEPSGPLAPGRWDGYRVDEPYIFRRNDGTWIMIYMGDEREGRMDGIAVEQVGYATSSTVMGPYTSYNENPVITFGPDGSFDHGTIADPWVYFSLGKYYIGYTVSPNDVEPFFTACATTTDWVNFTKIGVILPLAEDGWDATCSFRGAVTRVGDNYLFSYTGGSGLVGNAFRMGVATQQVYRTPPSIINNPETVFDFYDGFDGSSLDGIKWAQKSGYPSLINVSGGLLTLTATPSDVYCRLFGNTVFGMNYIMETRSAHPDQGTVGLFAELGFSDESLNLIRILDNAIDPPTYWQREAILSGQSDDFINMAQPADQNFHIFRVFRQSPNIAGFQVDNTTIETVSSNVPTGNLNPLLISYTALARSNTFIVDWTRVRKWAGSAPVITVGPEQGSSFRRWTGAVSTDWNTAGNWSDNTVPGSVTNVLIVSGSPVPHISTSGATCNDLTLESTASLIIDAGGALTVSGDLANNGTLTITSSGLSSSGSLIVRGASTGNVTYQRQMRTETNDGDYHYFASPVASNSNANTGKVSNVWQWDEGTGGWTPLGITSVVSGRGYNLDQTNTSDGLISFTGPIINSDVSINVSSPYGDVITAALSDYNSRTFVSGRSLINYGGGGWNMLGNPFTSAFLVSDFINTNTGLFDPNYVAVYLYDGASSEHRRYYYIGESTGWGEGIPGSQLHVQAGQGFFVLAMNNYSTFTFDRSMQQHSNAAVMYKSTKPQSRWPGLQLKIKSGEDENMTTIIFDDKMTVGLDPGYDVGLMSYGPGAGVYTALVKDNGINFARQALPVKGFNKNVIPVGIDFEDGGEVTFTAEIEQLRTFKFILEDRLTGIFTNLNSNSYKVTLPAKNYGTGRFYVHVSGGIGLQQKSDKSTLMGVRIWTSPNSQVNIQGAVSDLAICEVFDLNGRKVYETRLSGSDYNSFSIPMAITGVYLVRMTDGTKIVTQRVVIL